MEWKENKRDYVYRWIDRMPWVTNYLVGERRLYHKTVCTYEVQKAIEESDKIIMGLLNNAK